MSLCSEQYRTYLPGLVNLRVHVPDAWSGDLNRCGPDFTLTSCMSKLGFHLKRTLSPFLTVSFAGA